MIFLTLALKSIRNRQMTTVLTILSIALSTALLLAVERTRRAAEEGFTQSVSQTDLIVGARSGPVNLILYTVFNMGSATNNISWKTYEEIKSHPSVDWTIPYSLGDGHRGFRVVATDNNFFEHYRFRGDQSVQVAKGNSDLSLWKVVIGSEVQKKLSYGLGDKVVIAHGVTRGEGIQKHDDKPFAVSGILKPTGTAIDTSVYVGLKSMEAIHMDWKNGAAPTSETAIAQDEISEKDIHVGTITAFFLRTKSRIDTLRLQREINNFQAEPLLAIIPGVTLSELWRSLSVASTALQVISWMVIGVGLISMLIALLTGLNERRREMAILRSVGASPAQISFLLVLESATLTLMGVMLGLVFELLGFFVLRSWIADQFGLYLSGEILTSNEVIYLVVTLVLGVLIGFIPALKASQTALKDGLSVKV